MPRASRAITSAAWAVLKAGALRSGVSSCTAFMANSGQYSQSKFSVMKPVLSPVPIFSAAFISSSKLVGGPASPALANRVLL